jgi:hypothetical protein
MNNKKRVTSVLIVSVLLAGVAQVTAASEVPSKEISPIIVQTLKDAGRLELSARAAGLVIQAKKADRVETAKQVVREAVILNPNAILAVVGAIAFATPEVAPDVAVQAVALLPDRLELITKAVASGAPGEAKRITSALASAYPMKFDRIALATSLGAPKAASHILEGITEALPGLKPFINQAQIGLNPPSIITGHPLAATSVVTINQLNLTLSQVKAFTDSVQSQYNNLPASVQSSMSVPDPQNPGQFKADFSKIATLILQGNIKINVPLNPDGTPDTQNATMDLSNSKVVTDAGLTPTEQSQVANSQVTVNNSTIVTQANNASTVPQQIITSTTTVVVTKDTVRKYSSP